MQFHKNDNVLLIGTGSGYLTECISHLTNTVSAYECDNTLYQTSKHNLDMYSNNRHKLFLYKENIFKDLDKIKKYTRLFLPVQSNHMTSFSNIWVKTQKAFVFCGKVSRLMQRE